MRKFSRRVAGLAGLALVAGLACPSAPARAQGTLSALQTDVDLIARRARPSVVSVVAESPVSPRAARGGQVVRPRLRVGSGVAVEEDAILTAASVVMGAKRVFVRTSNGIEVEARLAGVDLILNIAYLRVPELRLPPIRLATDRVPQVGDWSIALGTSFRQEPTQSVGTVVDRVNEPGLTRFQLTNTVYPGNSGGPVLNASGELVGLVLGELTATGTEVERRPGANSLMLSLDHVRVAWDDLRRLGRVRHGWFGVGSRAAFVESSTQKGLRVPLGVLVESVTPGGPAERAGLRPGDLVVAFEGVRVEYPEQFGRWITAMRPGSLVELVWVRNEVRQSARVTLGESPVAQPDWAVAAAVPAERTADGSGQRITELEREIERLRAEVARLRGQRAGVSR
jgi:serine protease Do